MCVYYVSDRTEDTVESELSCKQPDAVYSCVRKKSSATKLETPYTRELMGNFCKDVTVPFNKRMIERVPEPEQKVTHEVNSEQRAKGNTNQGDPTYASVSVSSRIRYLFHKTRCYKPNRPYTLFLICFYCKQLNISVIV